MVWSEVGGLGSSKVETISSKACIRLGPTGLIVKMFFLGLSV